MITGKYRSSNYINLVNFLIMDLFSRGLDVWSNAQRSINIK